jgi:hypothetical protein
MRDDNSAPRRHRRRTWAVIAVAMAALMGLSGAFGAASANADSPSPSTSTSSSTDALNPARAKKVCARLPKVTAKVDKALSRIQGGADTKGSVAWLNAKAAKADTDGKTALANVYRARAKARTDRVTVLQDRKTALAQTASWCKSAGY